MPTDNYLDGYGTDELLGDESAPFESWQERFNKGSGRASRGSGLDPRAIQSYQEQVDARRQNVQSQVLASVPAPSVVEQPPPQSAPMAEPVQPPVETPRLVGPSYDMASRRWIGPLSGLSPVGIPAAPARAPLNEVEPVNTAGGSMRIPSMMVDRGPMRIGPRYDMLTADRLDEIGTFNSYRPDLAAPQSAPQPIPQGIVAAPVVDPVMGYGIGGDATPDGALPVRRPRLERQGTYLDVNDPTQRDPLWNQQVADEGDAFGGRQRGLRTTMDAPGIIDPHLVSGGLTGIPGMIADNLRYAALPGPAQASSYTPDQIALLERMAYSGDEDAQVRLRQVRANTYAPSQIVAPGAEPPMEEVPYVPQLSAEDRRILARAADRGDQRAQEMLSSPPSQSDGRRFGHRPTTRRGVDPTGGPIPMRASPSATPPAPTMQAPLVSQSAPSTAPSPGGFDYPVDGPRPMVDEQQMGPLYLPMNYGGANRVSLAEAGDSRVLMDGGAFGATGPTRVIERGGRWDGDLIAEGQRDNSPEGIAARAQLEEEIRAQEEANWGNRDLARIHEARAQAPGLARQRQQEMQSEQAFTRERDDARFENARDVARIQKERAPNTMDHQDLVDERRLAQADIKAISDELYDFGKSMTPEELKMRRGEMASLQQRIRDLDLMANDLLGLSGQGGDSQPTLDEVVASLTPLAEKVRAGTATPAEKAEAKRLNDLRKQLSANAP